MIAARTPVIVLRRTKWRPGGLGRVSDHYCAPTSPPWRRRRISARRTRCRRVARPIARPWATNWRPMSRRSPGRWRRPGSATSARRGSGHQEPVVHRARGARGVATAHQFRRRQPGRTRRHARWPHASAASTARSRPSTPPAPTRIGRDDVAAALPQHARESAGRLPALHAGSARPHRRARNPGSALPGITGGVCLLLAFLAFQVLPINVAGLLLVALGVGLLVLEIKFPTFGALGVGGVVSLVLGSIVLMGDTRDLRVGLWVIVPAMLTFGAISCSWGAWPSRRNGNRRSPEPTACCANADGHSPISRPSTSARCRSAARSGRRWRRRTSPPEHPSTSSACAD